MLADFWNALPPLAQKAITDFWTYFLPAALALNWALPDDGNWHDWVIAVGIALLGIVVNAARRVIVDLFIPAASAKGK